MESNRITAVEYQQCTLAGFAVREYLLAKWGWTWAYCGATGVALNIDTFATKPRVAPIGSQLGLCLCPLLPVQGPG